MKKFSTPPLQAEREYSRPPYSDKGLGTISFIVILFLMTVCSFSAFSQNAVTTHAGSSQGFMDATGSSAKFHAPTGICISPDGQWIYVADYSGHRIRKINAATKAVSTIAGNGTSGYVDAAGTAARFSYPSGVCISSDGATLYVSDYGNSYIRKIILATGTVSTIAGNGAFSYADNANGLAASFNTPTDIENGGDTVLYVSDTENHLIRKINLITSAVSTIAGMAGVPSFQNGIGTSAAFRYPKGLAISADGTTLYIADNGNNMIRSIQLATKNVTTLAGDGTAGYVDHSSGAMAKLNAPNGVSIVPGMPDVLFVADNVNHRVRRITVSTTAVSTIAGTGAVPPASTFGDNANGMSAKFFYPTNLVVSPDGQDLYVADQGNFRVRKVKTDLVSGIAENSSWGQFMVYPNPGSGFFIVSGTVTGSEKLNLELFDVTGKLIRTSENNSIQTNELFKEDISGLPAGIYFIRIRQGGLQVTKKLMVTR